MANEYKYILWDHDGVLVDTERLYFEATRKTLAEFSVELKQEKYLEFMARGESSWQLARKAGIKENLIEQYRTKRQQYYRELLVESDIDIPGVEEVLKDLSEKYSMGIITTSRRADFDLIQKDRGIVGFMEFVLCVEDYPRAKPHPDPYLAGLAKFASDPREAVVVEDSERGLRSANAAGIDCYIIEHEFTRSHDFSLARKVLPSLTALRDILL